MQSIAVKMDADVAAELKALRKLKKEHERLKMEHDLPSDVLPEPYPVLVHFQLTRLASETW